MQKRLGIVLGLIVAFRFLAHIPVPLAEPTKLKAIIDNVVNSSDFGGFLNLMSGGALAQMSIVLVGMSPFITASIITQLLTKAIPKLEELHKDGESGRRKINQWTRIVSVPLAVIQSIAYDEPLRVGGCCACNDSRISTINVARGAYHGAGYRQRYIITHLRWNRQPFTYDLQHAHPIAPRHFSGWAKRLQLV